MFYSGPHWIGWHRSPEGRAGCFPQFSNSNLFQKPQTPHPQPPLQGNNNFPATWALLSWAKRTQKIDYHSEGLSHRWMLDRKSGREDGCRLGETKNTLGPTKADRNRHQLLLPLTTVSCRSRGLSPWRWTHLPALESEELKQTQLQPLANEVKPQIMTASMSCNMTAASPSPSKSPPTPCQDPPGQCTLMRKCIYKRGF